MKDLTKTFVSSLDEKGLSNLEKDVNDFISKITDKNGFGFQGAQLNVLSGGSVYLFPENVSLRLDYRTPYNENENFGVKIFSGNKYEKLDNDTNKFFKENNIYHVYTQDLHIPDVKRIIKLVVYKQIS